MNTPVHFLTDDGIEVPPVTANQMRLIDRIAIQETGPNLFQMMENAGRTLALHALQRLGSRWKDALIVVLAGPGGNGGGGICAARHLANRNVDVRLVLSAPDRLGDVPAFQRKVFASAGGRETDLVGLGRSQPDLIVDALIGYSLRSAPHGQAADLIIWANESGSPIVALDVPSGLDATSGESPGACIRAQTTLTLALPKTGLLGEAVGDVWLADLGIPRVTFERAGVAPATPFGTRDCVHLALR